MSRAGIFILMVLSATVIAITILCHIGDSRILRHLLTPAAIIMGAGMIALSISDREPKE